MSKEKKKISGGIKFFLGMALIYLVMWFYKPEFMIPVLSDFGRSFVRIIPMLGVVYFIMFLINFFVSSENIQKHLGKESGIRGWAYSILAGIFIPSPPYVVFPLLGEFQKRGMRNSLIVLFLYSRNLQITFLPVMIFYFGFAFSITIYIYAFIFAIVSGLVIGKVLDRDVAQLNYE